MMYHYTSRPDVHDSQTADILLSQITMQDKVGDLSLLHFDHFDCTWTAWSWGPVVKADFTHACGPGSIPCAARKKGS